MKTTILINLLLTVILLISCNADNSKLMHNGFPLISASEETIDYKIGNDWMYGWWNIAPHVDHDTLIVTCYADRESFMFKTDQDSIALEIGPGESKDFYVVLKDSLYAHTVIHGVDFVGESISHDTISRSDELNIKHQDRKNKYLTSLKEAYPLDFITSKMSDQETALAVMNWTRQKWEHDGNNSPSKNDAITILDEVEEGARFPCFAYAIVIRDQLNALGYKARTIYLKTKDAALRQSPPGHVATEVYLDDLRKWVLLDGQFNVMPTLNGQPLNAVEFQNAIANRYNDFELQTLQTEPVSKRSYVSFVYDYLYYLDTSLDNRYHLDEKHLVDGKRSIMLVPSGAKQLSHIKFWDMEVDYCVYTNSLADFYKAPK